MDEQAGKNSFFAKAIKNGLNFIGIFDGEYAYKGPDCVQVDLTNNCNNDCVACWCNSPLLGEKRISAAIKNKSLDYKSVIKLIDVLKAMHTSELYFSGGGEPLMHPAVMDILAYAKSKGFNCTLHTNFTLADENVIGRLKEIELDSLVVSLWAATPQMYVKTHPNKTEKDFVRMTELLKRLNQVKHDFPRVKIYNVISNINYKELVQMADFCLETFSEEAEFTVVDTIPQHTDKLLVNEEEKKELLQMAEKIKHNPKYYKNGKCVISGLDQFIRRVSSEYGKSAEYDRELIDALPCYIGWVSARVLADGNVNSCLKSHRFPVGNLYNDDFSGIWNGARQREFRKRVCNKSGNRSFLSFIGNDPSRGIGCYKSCDDLGRNMVMHKKISALTPLQKSILKRFSGVCRFGRKIFR